jgi:hypothetical protein
MTSSPIYAILRIDRLGVRGDQRLSNCSRIAHLGGLKRIAEALDWLIGVEGRIIGMKPVEGCNLVIHRFWRREISEKGHMNYAYLPHRDAQRSLFCDNNRFNKSVIQEYKNCNSDSFS